MMRKTTKTTAAAFALMSGTLMCSFSCGGGDDNAGPTLISLRDASAGQSTGSGGQMAGAGAGGGSVGGSDSTGGATDQGEPLAESGVGSAGGGPVQDATGDGACPAPVTSEDYLNACPDPRVLGCLTFRTQLPNPLPQLP